METQENTTAQNTVMSPAQLLTHWQGHRSLTRKVLEAFPEDKLFSYSIGGMRPFAELLMEIIDLTSGGVEGMATGKWKSMDEMSHVNGPKPATKQELLKIWDQITDEMNQLWSHITPARFQEVVVAFGAYEGPVYSTLLYFIDNEIHHRGQAYAYLRSLGITPPPFWDR
jgi:uncharacterized damage-inducible protein DinB